MQDVTLEETALAEVSLLFFPPSVVAVAGLIHENRKKQKRRTSAEEMNSDSAQRIATRCSDLVKVEESNGRKNKIIRLRAIGMRKFKNERE